MRWQQGRRSTNVEDRRGQKVKKAGAIGGGTALLMGGLGLLLGGDPLYILMMILNATAGGQPVQTRAPTAEENVAADFVTSVLGYTEDTWAEIFAEEGLTVSARYARAVHRCGELGLRLQFGGHRPVLLSIRRARCTSTSGSSMNSKASEGREISRVPT